jgi:type VI secretion system secreted protein Hcp
MAQDIFIKINGIDGESQDKDHKNEIEIIDWNWNIFQQSNMHGGSGGGAGKATVDDLEFVHSVDRASPNLMKYCLAGKHIDEATLVVRKAGGKPLEYLKITMSDVVITKVQPFLDSFTVSSTSQTSSGPVTSTSTDSRISERIRLSFARVKQEYTVQNAQGGSGGTVTASFDIQKNQEG